MKTHFILLLACFLFSSWVDQESKNGEPGMKIELQENKIYTIPAGKKWKIDVATFNKLSFCEHADCEEELHFFRSVTQKAKARSTTIKGSITLPSGITIKTRSSETPIIVQELAATEN